MWKFFQILLHSNEVDRDVESTPELVVQNDRSASGTESLSVVDEESGRSFKYENLGDSNNSATSGARHSSNDDDDGDDDEHQNGAYLSGNVIEEEDDEDEDDEDEEDTRPGFYQDQSDEEPDEEFLTGFYEYLKLEELCYVVRGVNTGRADILAHESTPLVAFCFALMRHSSTVMSEVLRTMPAEPKSEVAIDVRNDASPLGIAGWFVKNVLGKRPVFAFDDLKTGKGKHIVDATPAVESAENPALVAVDLNDGTGSNIALLVNGADFADRAQLAYEISQGMRSKTAIDVLQHTYAFKHLRLFNRQGTTAPERLESSTDDGFTPYSPVSSSNGRWYVVSPGYYAMFKSNELLVIRSGSSIARLARLLDSDRPVFSEPTPNVTAEQERQVLARLLRSEIASKERERDNERTKLITSLRAKCGQLANMRERLLQIGTQRQPFATTDSDEEVLRFFAETLLSVDGVVRKLDEDQKQTFL